MKLGNSDTREQPVLVAAIVRLVAVVITFFGLERLTDAEVEAIIAAVGAVWVALEIITSRFAWRRVTPVEKAERGVETLGRLVNADPRHVEMVKARVRNGQL